MIYRKKIKFFVIIQFLLIGCKSDNYSDSLPNIIIIYTDDLGYGDVVLIIYLRLNCCLDFFYEA